jgi:NADH-quinone oxidoreductase subunit A
MGSIAFCVVVYIAWSILKPNRPNAEKLSSYECGEEAEGAGWYGFNVRFYRIALFFILFEAEVILLYPWALAFNDGTYQAKWGMEWSSFLLAELIVFMLLLMAGLAYVWKKGYLNWDIEKVQTEQQSSPVPLSMYEKVNDKYKSA